MSTEFVENKATENARKALEEDRKVTDKVKATYAERIKGKPTPTQEENDLTMLGAHIHKHEDDGSGPDPYATRDMEPASGGGYQTRHEQPTRHAAPHTPQRSVPRSTTE